MNVNNSQQNQYVTFKQTSFDVSTPGKNSSNLGSVSSAKNASASGISDSSTKAKGNVFIRFLRACCFCGNRDPKENKLSQQANSAQQTSSTADRQTHSSGKTMPRNSLQVKSDRQVMQVETLAGKIKSIKSAEKFAERLEMAIKQLKSGAGSLNHAIEIADNKINQLMNCKNESLKKAAANSDLVKQYKADGLASCYNAGVDSLKQLLNSMPDTKHLSDSINKGIFTNREHERDLLRKVNNSFEKLSNGHNDFAKKTSGGVRNVFDTVSAESEKISSFNGLLPGSKESIQYDIDDIKILLARINQR